MRVGMDRVNDLSDEDLAFVKQLGVDDVQMCRPGRPGDQQWEYEYLMGLRQRTDQAGLRLMALENVPVSFYDRAMLGQPGRDQQIEHMCATIRNMGKAGIPILGYHWMANAASMHAVSAPKLATLRGGATAFRFDLEEYLEENRDAPLSEGRVYTEAEMWAHYDYYLERILPVAEEAGVKLALHPDDPPLIESLRGVARLFRDFAGFRRAMEKFGSPNHGLNFCIGCWCEMGLGEVLDAIRYFGPQGKIFYAHFRGVQGQVPCYTECFVDQADLDLFEVVNTLKEVGFDGFMLPDHVPHLAGDTPWGHRGRAHAIGYMQALIQAVYPS